LADHLVSEHKPSTELDDVNNFMDWQAIEDLLCDIHAKHRGNSAWPPLFMFKALLLQSWHNLSDPALEKQLDRPNKDKEGNVHDSNHFTERLSGYESAVYPDSAYKSRTHDEWFEQRGIDNRVMGRAYRNTPLTKAQKQKNQRNAGVRCTVERVFGVFKLYYGMGQARYLGLARNAVRFGLMCFAYNLQRGINIQRSCNPSHYSCA
jgi:hypothetical protein